MAVRKGRFTVARLLPAVVILVALAGCQSVALPVYAEDGSDVQLLARGEGQLALQGNCVVLILPSQEEPYLVLWPPGTFWDPLNETVVSEGTRLRIGDTVVLGGGEFNGGPVVDESGWISPPSSECQTFEKVW